MGESMDPTIPEASVLPEREAADSLLLFSDIYKPRSASHYPACGAGFPSTMRWGPRVVYSKLASLQRDGSACEALKPGRGVGGVFLVSKNNRDGLVLICLFSTAVRT